MNDPTKDKSGSLPIRYASLFLSAIVCLIACARVDSKVETANIAEATLRSFAASAILPSYPTDSSVCGVVVAELEIDGAGKLKRVTILEAPDQSSRDASYAAISRWQFRPPNPKDAPNVEYVGKLTFYFASADVVDGPAVFDPGKAPNIAACTDRNLEKQSQVLS